MESILEQVSAIITTYWPQMLGYIVIPLVLFGFFLHFIKRFF